MGAFLISSFCEYFLQAWSFDMINGKRASLSALPHGRSHFTTVVIGNHIYVFAGEEAKDERWREQTTFVR